MITLHREEIRYIMADTPSHLFEEINEVTQYWVLQDPEYVPPSSSQIREVVAQLVREKFYVVQGGIDG